MLPQLPHSSSLPRFKIMWPGYVWPPAGPQSPWKKLGWILPISHGWSQNICLYPANLRDAAPNQDPHNFTSSDTSLAGPAKNLYRLIKVEVKSISAQCPWLYLSNAAWTTEEKGKKGAGGKERASSILLSCRIWFSAIKKEDIEECFSFHHFAVGNCFPHGALGFDVSPAAVTQVTARAVPVQMCYLSVSLLTLWLNRSSCGQRAISALYHTIWHFMESFRVFSWKNFLSSMAGSFEEI